MIDFFGALVRNHGWHFVAELAALALVTAFTLAYLAAMARGRVRAVSCPACGRLASRAHAACPRCGEPLAAP